GASFSDDAGWDVSDDGGEKDGARDLTLNVRGGAELTEIFSLRGSLRYVDREGEFDSIVGTFGCGGPDCYVVDARGFETDSQLLIGGLAADLDTFDGAFVITPSLGYASEDSQTRDTGVSNNDSSTVNIGLQGALTFGAQDAHTLVGALQWKRETFESESAFSSVDESREQFGYVLDYRGDLTDALFVQGGLRFDDNDGFDDFLSWSASASYRFFSTGTRLRGSVGRAQTNPDFFQQFGSTATFIPNPDLKPERNFGWDVGVDQTFWSGRAEIGATYFNETLEDEIATTFGPPPDFIATPVNVDGDSDRQGVELSFRVAPIEGLSIGANYTYLDASEPSNGATAVEVRRPRHSGAVDAFYTFLGGRATIGGEAVWAAGGKDLNFGDPSATSPRADLDDYVVVNITGSYAINEAVELYGGVRNLFDTDYQEVLGYAEQPLTAFAGLRAAF
ncbi:MAG: TonB-dependent receptor, partial [Pseudomonadota bacterium]